METNNENSSGSHTQNLAFSTVMGRLNALEKLVAEQYADLNGRISNTKVLSNLALTEVGDLKKEFYSLKEAQSVAALALEVFNIRMQYETLINALKEEFADDEEEGDAEDLQERVFGGASQPSGQQSLESAKAAYLHLVGSEADTATIYHIETADTLIEDDQVFHLVNTAQDRKWTIPRDVVESILARKDRDE